MILQPETQPILLPLFMVFAAALALSLVLTHRVRGWAGRLGTVDDALDEDPRVRPGPVPEPGSNGRSRFRMDPRFHRGPVPALGGVGVYLSTLLVAGPALAWFGRGASGLPGNPSTLLALLVGGALIFAVGLWDDARGLRARFKFLIEVAIALGIFAAGIRLDSVGLPGGGVWFMPLWLSLGLTVLWIVGITNAFNLIDGSDGVAAGAALFASGAIAIVSLINGDVLGAIVALALAGAALGFLFFNFPPASIFLGDSGSLFLGFSLAAVGLVTAQKASTALAVAIPVVSFGLPVVDAGLAVVRRFLRGDRIFDGDHGHIHHRLRDFGLSPRTIALLLYAVCGAFALLALLLTRPMSSISGVVLMVAGAAGLICVQRLKFPELVELNRLMHRGIHQRAVIAHNIRMRRAVARLRAADGPRAVLEVLEGALDAGGFERAELWLPQWLGYALAGQPAVAPDDGGWAWSWRAPSSPAEISWEVRLPLRNEWGRAVGRLSVWQSDAAAEVYSDLPLIATELVPELQRALVRLRKDNAAAPIPRERALVAGSMNSP